MHKYWRLNSAAIHTSINCWMVDGKKSFLDQHSSGKIRKHVDLRWLNIVEFIAMNSKDHEIIFYSASVNRTFACDLLAFMIQFQQVTMNYNNIWNQLNDK